MKTLITAFIVLTFAACGNGENENKGTETAPSSAHEDNTHADTMMRPNGLSNGTATADTTNK